MPSLDGTVVRILVDGLPLVEYRDPDGAEDLPHVATRYVEVKAGQQFTMMTKWTAGFNLRFATHLYFRVWMDDQNYYSFNTLEAGTLPHRKGALIDDHSSEVDKISALDHASGRWNRCSFTFGALGITKPADDDAGNNRSPEAVAKLGLIRVECYRARKVPLETPYVWHGNLGAPLDELPESVLKGKALKNNVKLADTCLLEHIADPDRLPITERNTKPQEEQDHEYVPLKGRHGTIYEFKFLYRSRKILQSLGCISRSPSPPPDAMLMLERTEEMLRIAKREKREANLRVLEMQDRLARAESGTSTLVDLDGNDNNDGIKREIKTEITNTRGVKRDRTDSDDDVTGIAPRLQKPRIEIDLKKEVQTTYGGRSRGSKRERDDSDDDLVELGSHAQRRRIDIDLTKDN